MSSFDGALDEFIDEQRETREAEAQAQASAQADDWITNVAPQRDDFAPELDDDDLSDDDFAEAVELVETLSAQWDDLSEEDRELALELAEGLQGEVEHRRGLEQEVSKQYVTAVIGKLEEDGYDSKEFRDLVSSGQIEDPAEALAQVLRAGKRSGDLGSALDQFVAQQRLRRR